MNAGEEDPRGPLATTQAAATLAASVRLKPFPASAARAVALLSHTSYDLKEVCALVERDPAIAAGVLRVAAGVAFRARMPPRSLAEVVTRLGSRETQAAIISVAALDLFVDSTGLGERLRQHTSATGAIARALARGGPLETEAFLAGLLHDIGKL